MDEGPRRGRDGTEGIERILAPNAGPMTGPGTNTYLVGRSAPVMIDPGPDDPGHLAAIGDALGGRHVAAVLVTHAHGDHADGAARAGATFGAPVLAFGPAAGFAPDLSLRDGQAVAGLTALHTPGHMAGHMAFLWRDHLFAGDTVMGWSSTVIAPPEGDMAAYLATLDRLRRVGAAVIWPGHGDPLRDPDARIAALIAHRHVRRNEVLDTLRAGPSDPATVTTRIYGPLAQDLAAAAEATVLAHLLHLEAEGFARRDGPAFRLQQDPGKNRAAPPLPRPGRLL